MDIETWNKLGTIGTWVGIVLMVAFAYGAAKNKARIHSTMGRIVQFAVLHVLPFVYIILLSSYHPFNKEYVLLAGFYIMWLTVGLGWVIAEKIFYRQRELGTQLDKLRSELRSEFRGQYVDLREQETDLRGWLRSTIYTSKSVLDNLSTHSFLRTEMSREEAIELGGRYDKTLDDMHNKIMGRVYKQDDNPAGK